MFLSLQLSCIVESKQCKKWAYMVSWITLYMESLDSWKKFYGKELDKDQLKLRVDILVANHCVKTQRYDLPTLLSQVKEMSQAQRLLIGQVCTVRSLILFMPATNTVSELSFHTCQLCRIYCSSPSSAQKRLFTFNARKNWPTTTLTLLRNTHVTVRVLDKD